MRGNTVIPWLTTLIIGIPCAGVSADPIQTESHGAHEHGVAEMTLATEANQLELMLVSPVANLLGFEHAPANAAEHEAWQKSRQMLQSGVWLQLPAAAKCQLQQQQLNDPWPAGSTTHQHADLTLSLTYHCDAPQALTGVQLDLFSLAADLHEVNVQWVSSTAQGAATLSAKAAGFRLTTAD